MSPRSSLANLTALRLAVALFSLAALPSAQAETPASSPGAASSEFDAVQRFDEAARWLPPDTIMVGVADTSVGPGFDIFAPLIAGECPKHECNDTAEERKKAAIARITRRFVQRFESQLGFDPRKVESIAFGMGPRWSSVIVFGDLGFKPTRGQTKTVAGETIHELDADNRYDPTMWAYPLEENRGLVLMSDPAGFAAALGKDNPATLADSDARRKKLRAGFEKAADAAYVTVTDIEDDSLVARAVDMERDLELPRAATIALKADGTLDTVVRGRSMSPLDGLFEGRELKRFARDLNRAYRRRHGEVLPMEAILGILYTHGTRAEDRRGRHGDTADTTEVTERKIELGMTPPIAILAAYSAMSLPSVQDEVRKAVREVAVDEGIERLGAISHAAKTYFENSKKVVDGKVTCQMPPIGKLTREADACCGADDAQHTPAGPICATDPTAWQSKSWRAIDYSIDEPHRFAFRIAADEPQVNDATYKYGEMAAEGRSRDNDGQSYQVTIHGVTKLTCGSKRSYIIYQTLTGRVVDGKCKARIGPDVRIE